MSIQLCYLPNFYEHLVTTHTHTYIYIYEKYTLSLDEIMAALMPQCQCKQNTRECSQGEGLYAKRNQDRGRTQGKKGFWEEE